MCGCSYWGSQGWFSWWDKRCVDPTIYWLTSRRDWRAYWWNNWWGWRDYQWRQWCIQGRIKRRIWNTWGKHREILYIGYDCSYIPSSVFCGKAVAGKSGSRGPQPYNRRLAAHSIADSPLDLHSNGGRLVLDVIALNKTDTHIKVEVVEPIQGDPITKVHDYNATDTVWRRLLTLPVRFVIWALQLSNCSFKVWILFLKSFVSARDWLRLFVKFVISCALLVSCIWWVSINLVLSATISSNCLWKLFNCSWWLAFSW